jgi:hypothetical protein
MRRLWLLFCLAACVSLANAQKTVSAKNAVIRFVSTRNSDVQAVNNKASVTLSEAGAVNFSLLVKDFKFAMADMEDHFNKEYMESDKYPNASFKGRILGVNKIDLNKAASYKVKAEGEMLIRNVVKKILVSGTLQVEKNRVNIKARFTIDIDDYKIDTGLGGVIIGDKMNIEVAAILF